MKVKTLASLEETLRLIENRSAWTARAFGMISDEPKDGLEARRSSTSIRYGRFTQAGPALRPEDY